MASDLRTEVVRGAGWTAAQKWAVRASGLLVFAALSRLLGPAQIGMGSLAIAVTSLLSIPLELAVTSFLVQSRTVDAKTENTVFWTAIAVSGLGIALVFGTAELIRYFQGPPQLSNILMALSPVLLITAVEAVPSARLSETFGSEVSPCARW